MTNSNNLIDILIAAKEIKIKQNNIIKQFDSNIELMLNELNLGFEQIYTFDSKGLKHSVISEEQTSYWISINGIAPSEVQKDHYIIRIEVKNGKIYFQTNHNVQKETFDELGRIIKKYL